MKSINKIISLMMVPALLAGCHKVDNSYSHSNFQVELTASAQTVILDEENPDATALTLSWTPAKDYGDEFLMTYTYSIEVTTSTASVISEFEDEENFEREYSNAELQNILVNHFGIKTSSYCELLVKASCSYAGPYVVIPDEAVLRLRIKTYGPKQFGADQVAITGSALGGKKVNLDPSATNANIYIYTGNLEAGNFYYPVVYGDENNAIVPEGNTTTGVSSDAMPAGVVDESKVNGGWVVSEPNEYRVTLNMANKTVTVIKTEDIFDFDKLYLAGTAVGEEPVELRQTIENPSLYAFYGELNEGTFYIPIEYNEATTLSIVPKSTGHDFVDGVAGAFSQTRTSATNVAYWNIPQAAKYRVVLDVTAMTITFYSPATAKANKTVSYNNTVAGVNPFTQDVTELWMYGSFNNFEKDADAPFTGFQKEWCLAQSAADPCVFCYYGKAVRRNAGATSYVNFKVSNIHNNVYCYGSTADAKRNDHDGFITPVLGTKEGLKEGQSDNRYAYFYIPEGCNCIILNIETLEVVFDKR